VVFSRDPVMSQAAARMQKVLLPGPPQPAVPVTGRSFDHGNIEILGYDLTAGAPGGKATLAVYLLAKARPTRTFRLGAALWATPAGATGEAALTLAMPPQQVRVGARVTLDGSCRRTAGTPASTSARSSPSTSPPPGARPTCWSAW
jgi:hypothetical protein